MATSQITLRFKVYRGDDLVAEETFSEPSISIGRSSSALMTLADESLGDLHAVINVEDDGTVALLDLGTDAGTFHNGQKIANAALSSGDEFTLGGLRFRVAFDEAETTTPTMDVRPEDGAVVTPADTTDGGLDESVIEDAMELVMRSGKGAGTAGIDTKAPKVLEVSQVWSNTLVDSKHYRKGSREVTIGGSVGFKWSLLGVQMGWVKGGVIRGALSVSPPIWSDVQSDFRDDFYISEESIPEGSEHELFVEKGNQWVARVHESWDVYAHVGQDGTEGADLAALLQSGRASRDGAWIEVPVTDDLRVLVDIGGDIFVAHMVYPGAKIVTSVTDNLDYPFLAIFLLCLFLGGAFGVLMFTSPKPPENEMVEIPDHFVDLMIEKQEPEEQQKKDDKPEADPDAGEGAKAKKEEGKVGKKEAKMEKAKGNKKEISKTEQDREIAENAGVLGAMDDLGGADGVFGSSGLDSQLTGGIGGLIGAKGVQIGSGGLGSRGSGLGGGGTAEGLGGLGTKGIGSGSSGFGKGGGSFGAKGSGRISAVSGDPIVMGALDRSLIDQVIKRKMSQIRYCYQRELQKDPSLAGKVTIQFTIAKDGTVSKAKAISSTVGSAAVDKCVESRFYKMQFPEPKGGGIVIVKYPFIFSPG